MTKTKTNLGEICECGYYNKKLLNLMDNNLRIINENKQNEVKNKESLVNPKFEFNISMEYQYPF